MALSDEDVREILRIIDESELDELRIDTGQFRLHVLRGDAARAAPAETPAAPEPEPAPAPSGGDGAASSSETRTIDATMPGTFYRAEGPGMDPFVEVGAQVEPGTVVCILEVMKMMNSIEAGVSGTIVEVCADDAQLVAEGDALFRVSPST
jgi:acetyl-CoA carboxylase biotin carboxyl carrier protein